MSGPPWEPGFDFYFVRMDGAPAAIALDMNAASHIPLASHPVRLSLRVPMKEPREDGLRARDEADALFALEDRLADSLKESLDGWMIGRVVYRGNTDLFFQLPPGKPGDDAKLQGAIESAGDEYEIQTKVDDDESWSFYKEFLWPDRYNLQTMQNRRVMSQLEQHGDDHAVERTVDHFAYFAEEGQARAAGVKLAQMGFRADDPEEKEGRWGLQFHRDDPLADGHIDELCHQILDVVEELGGDYDGWGCPVCQQATN